jgi:hypothetical protein
VFVLHDLFAMPFAEIASIVGRTPAAAKQLASRARRRVRGSPAASDAGRARQREVVGIALCTSLGRDDADPTGLPRAGLSSNHDLHIQVDRCQQVHQAFDGEAYQLVATS